MCGRQPAAAQRLTVAAAALLLVGEAVLQPNNPPAFHPNTQVAAKARAREAERPSPEALAHRDAAGDGLYSAAAPFWARVAGAR